ncbi:hypothetical protein [Myxococcus stipitatus]|nr:hypothetical protein [Myxococcus stipitatus]
MGLVVGPKGVVPTDGGQLQAPLGFLGDLAQRFERLSPRLREPGSKDWEDAQTEALSMATLLLGYALGAGIPVPPSKAEPTKANLEDAAAEIARELRQALDASANANMNLVPVALAIIAAVRIASVICVGYGIYKAVTD